MKVISKEDAKRIFKKDLEVGQYQMTQVFEGGVYSPKLKQFNMETLFETTPVIVSIVEDHYLYDGNGD